MLMKEQPLISDIAAGGRHSLVVTDDGVLYTFGYGTNGQLGLKSTSNKPRPHLVNDLLGKRVIQVAAGWNHSLVITANDSEIKNQKLNSPLSRLFPIRTLRGYLREGPILGLSLITCNLSEIYQYLLNRRQFSVAPLTSRTFTQVNCLTCNSEATLQRDPLLHLETLEKVSQDQNPRIFLSQLHSDQRIRTMATKLVSLTPK